MSDEHAVLLHLRTFCKDYGLGRTKVYELIEAGEVESVHVGRRHLIVAESARGWLRRLQEAEHKS
ncbi:MAG: excisionase [Acidobacteria bacterium]|nr:excisionase [Acidobacteriota bacterium]